jgi:hypothetical protein
MSDLLDVNGQQLMRDHASLHRVVRCLSMAADDMTYIDAYDAYAREAGSSPGARVGDVIVALGLPVETVEADLLTLEA